MPRFARSTRRHVAAITSAAILTMLLASTALAGGWASATLDSQPDDPGAGGTMVVSFTLLQHGVTPVDWGQPQVLLVDSQTGRSVTAEARREGPKGHWLAQLTVPADGTWRLEIRHELEVVPVNFAPITVGEAPPPAPAAATSSAPAFVAQPAVLLAAAFVGLLALTAAALGALAWRRTRTGQAGI
jgi:hypothetical protein